MKRLLSWFAVAAVAVAGLLVSTGSPALALDPPSNGYYTIYNSRSLDCLDQSYSGGVERAQIFAFDCNARTNQVWKVVRTGPVYFTLRNAKSGKCLNQSYSGGIERVDLIAFPCTNVLDSDNWGTYNINPWGIVIANARSDSKCIDQSYADGTPQTRVIAFSCKFPNELANNVTNQHWRLQSTERPVDAVV